MPRFITLTTDFGNGSPYVAAMKGVILSINPHATIVDITHGIAAHNVRQAALVVADATRWFPDQTIHVAVVDPGVGTQRGLIYLRSGTQQYLAPDNGLLSRLALDAPPSAPQVMYAAGHGVFSKSIDGGSTWESPATNLPGSDIHGFVADPDNADQVYANVVGFGILGSVDGGMTWSAVPANPNIMAMTMAIGGNSQTLYLPGAQDGLWHSQDGGQSWARVEQTPDEGAIAALYVRDNSRLYVTTMGNAAGLYVSEDQGGTWTSTGLNGFVM